MSNLVLLCGRHHTCVHEGGLRLRPRPDAPGFDVVLPDGRLLPRWWDAGQLDHQLRLRVAARREGRAARVEEVRSMADAAATAIRPTWAGERFDLHECVAALFRMRPEQTVLAA